MKLLELFSGTGSVGKVAKDFGFEVVSLDRDMNADIKTDIMDWDKYIHLNILISFGHHPHALNTAELKQ
jgi:hypothetical protein